MFLKLHRSNLSAAGLDKSLNIEFSLGSTK